MLNFPKPYLKIYESGGVDWQINIEPKPLHTLVFDSARKNPEKTAMIFYGHKVTYAQLAGCVVRVAAALYELGLRKGDRVALMLPNCPDFVFAYYAAMSLGGIVVNTNPMYVEREIEHQVNDSGSKMIITLVDLYPRVKNVRDNTPLEKVLLTGFTGKPEALPGDTIWFPDLYAVDRTPAPAVEIDPARDLAVLQYTGGTTGVSKGAMLTHLNLYANSMQTNHFFNNDAKKQLIMSVLPFFHVYGMTCCMNLAVASATTMLLVPRFVPGEIAQLISQYKPTFFPGVPTMFVAMLNSPEFKDYKDYASVMAYNSGGGPLPLEIGYSFDKLLEGTGSTMTEGYGLSESSPVTHCNPEFGPNKRGSIGVPYPGTHAAVVDIETGTRVLPVGEVGELVIQGPQVMAGYWNRPEQTAQTLKNGWLYTGDMARMDEDGYFYIVDRKKDLIIAGGYNIYPREVEEVLFEHAKVQEAVVAGVPDAYRGETVKAYVVLKEGQTATEQELIAFCRERLAPYKAPKAVEFRQELPKSAVGKLLRRKLVEEELKKLEQSGK
ncbi:long-chain-fatty-acid--CoA ligase [Desulfallas thermosapovorans]|uniref:Long-chain acyl-CoA synthetase n=1 Tax=Desulfallas thermosapovorans DSM 6562 TaxID=1121431 RepID=A0A5S4ZVJ7_9FIRM|nr:long-chain fatty acid--CoA ligase [Desulfallas thermosapovorans]TYO96942.1 long-chain acyl-CoA synthetase [Desulfallas thermosapovorans DSM 6562]